jgi:hypothetical protein
MAGRVRICFCTCCFIVVPVLLLWGFDRSQMMHWVGVTNLRIEFVVMNADSGQPIPDARIKVKSHGGFYDGGHEGEGPFELVTDAAGTVSRQLTNNRCIGSVSALKFTDTHHVYMPHWGVQVFAPGYRPSAWVNLAEEYHGQVERQGPENNRLVVRIPMQKANDQ